MSIYHNKIREKCNHKQIKKTRIVHALKTDQDIYCLRVPI